MPRWWYCPLCKKPFSSENSVNHLVQTEGVYRDLLPNSGVPSHNQVIAAAMETSFNPRGEWVCQKPDLPNTETFPPGCGNRFDSRRHQYYCCNGCGQRKPHTPDCPIPASRR